MNTTVQQSSGRADVVSPLVLEGTIRIKENEEITKEMFQDMGQMMILAMKKMERGMKYGMDMRSSRMSCMNDARNMLNDFLNVVSA